MNFFLINSQLYILIHIITKVMAFTMMKPLIILDSQIIKRNNMDSDNWCLCDYVD